MKKNIVTFIATMVGRDVSCEIHGPHQLNGDTELISAAGSFVRRQIPVKFGPPLGGGIASLATPWIAVTTLAAVCDPGSARFEGLDLSVPDGAIP